MVSASKILGGWAGRGCANAIRVATPDHLETLNAESAPQTDGAFRYKPRSRRNPFWLLITGRFDPTANTGCTEKSRRDLPPRKSTKQTSSTVLRSWIPMLRDLSPSAGTFFLATLPLVSGQCFEVNATSTKDFCHLEADNHIRGIRPIVF